MREAGIKIDSVASDLLGVSGRAMIEALIAGQRDPLVLAGLAKGLLRRKLEELQLACDGRFTAGHAQMCRLHLDARDHLTAKIAELDLLVAGAAKPFAGLVTRLQTIPGIGLRTAEMIVAETGGDMSRFPAPALLAAWCGLAPANRESAGKRMRAGTRKGNKHLSSQLVESAWSAARTRTRPGVRFRRLARRFGKGNEKKAAVAVARTLLCIAWTVMARGTVYAEQGEDFCERREYRNREHVAARHQQALLQLGYQVTLTPIAGPAPAPATRPRPRIPGGATRAGSAGAAARLAGAPSFVTGALYVLRSKPIQAVHAQARNYPVTNLRRVGGFHRGSADAKRP